MPFHKDSTIITLRHGQEDVEFSVDFSVEVTKDAYSTGDSPTMIEIADIEVCHQGYEITDFLSEGTMEDITVLLNRYVSRG